MFAIVLKFILEPTCQNISSAKGAFISVLTISCIHKQGTPVEEVLNIVFCLKLTSYLINVVFIFLLVLFTMLSCTINPAITGPNAFLPEY